MQSYRHQEDQQFITEGDAVLAFKFLYGERQGEEYGTYIQRDPKSGKYYMKEVLSSLMTGEDANSIILGPVDTNTSASVHTHWHPEGSLDFSPGDVENQHKLMQLGYNLNYYLINRQGEIIYRGKRK